MGQDLEALVSRLLDDPPQVHTIFDDQGRATDVGLWSTEADCYRFIAGRCAAGSRTFETGLGASTALFAQLGTDHVSIAFFPEEVERLQEYCRERTIAIDRISFHVGRSELILPGLDIGELDLVFVDGGHGFPLPIIDWFYAAGHLRKGGTLVLDDVNLPAVGMLTSFLDRDERWVKLARSEKWAAYERASEGWLGEDWWAQTAIFDEEPASEPRREGFVARARRAAGRFGRPQQ